MSGSWDDTVKVWDASLGESLLSLRGHTEDITMVTFSADSKHIASASEDKTTKIWDAQTGKMLVTLAGHSDIVTSVAFSPDGKRIAAGSKRVLTIWRLGKL